jgi:tetratricopeptide (TPR) repeat protein
MQIAMERTDGITPARAWGYSGLGTLSSIMGDRAGGEYIALCNQYAHQLGLKDLIAMTCTFTNFGVRDYQTAAANYESALALLRETGNRWYLNTVLFLYADRARAQGEIETAEKLYQESLTFARDEQHYFGMLSPMGNLGRIAAFKGDYQRGRQ